MTPEPNPHELIASAPQKVSLWQSVQYSLKTSYRQVGRGALLASLFAGVGTFVVLTALGMTIPEHFSVMVTALISFVCAMALGLTILCTSAVFLSIEASSRTARSRLEHMRHQRKVRQLAREHDLAGGLNLSAPVTEKSGQLSMTTKYGAVSVVDSGERHVR